MPPPPSEQDESDERGDDQQEQAAHKVDRHVLLQISGVRPNFHHKRQKNITTRISTEDVSLISHGNVAASCLLFGPSIRASASTRISFAPQLCISSIANAIKVNCNWPFYKLSGHRTIPATLTLPFVWCESKKNESEAACVHGDGGGVICCVRIPATETSKSEANWAAAVGGGHQ